MTKLLWVFLIIPFATSAQTDRLFGKGVSIEEVYGELNERICQGHIKLIQGLDTTFKSTIDSSVRFNVNVTHNTNVRTVFIENDKIFEATFRQRHFTLEAYSNKVSGTTNRKGNIKNLEMEVDGCVLVARKVSDAFEILSDNNCGERAAQNSNLVEFIGRRAQMLINSSVCNRTHKRARDCSGLVRSTVAKRSHGKSDPAGNAP